jgi:ribonuclease III
MEKSSMTEDRTEALARFQEILQYRFRDAALLDMALTHRSWVNENPALACRDNERLEFLGDAVLELCISDMLMETYPDYQEGPLSQLRASIVNEQPLALLAKSFQIGDYLLLGKGEENSGGRTKTSILSNTLEALMAAIYLDSGFEETAALVRRLFARLIGEGYRAYRDYKTTVQQICQHRFKETPRYSLIRECGPDHDKIFEIQLSVADRIVTVGSGKNKKEAEQRAAEKALPMLEKLSPTETE